MGQSLSMNGFNERMLDEVQIILSLRNRFHSDSNACCWDNLISIFKEVVRSILVNSTIVCIRVLRIDMNLLLKK